jgi:hypothetical protein
MIDSLSSEELQFIKAIEKYKTENQKHFLSWTEVLKIVKDLGYKRVSRKHATPPNLKEVKEASKAPAREAAVKEAVKELVSE